MANSVDPDETACYELSHLDLHCLRKYLCWSTGLKGLNKVDRDVRHPFVSSIFSLSSAEFSLERAKR